MKHLIRERSILIGWLLLGVIVAIILYILENAL